MACLVLLLLATGVNSQNPPPLEGYEQLNPEGLRQIDHIHDALQRVGRISVIVGVAALLVVGLRWVAPLSILDSMDRKRLAKATRDVDGLLERIRTDAETVNTKADEQNGDEGVLAAMLGVSELDQDTEVPAYVLTVNDIMLDGMVNTLTRLRRMHMAKAVQYRDYMFIVLNGIKTITEQCEATGAASSLAVNVRDYFSGEHRYRRWKHLLSAYARKGDHRESAQTFLRFMKKLNENEPLTLPSAASAPSDTGQAAQTWNQADIPEILQEESLPTLQQAAAEEAERLIDRIQTDRPAAMNTAWQFELVHRQQRLHLRDDAKKMLDIFLHEELKALRRITKTKMLPCRTWNQILYLLGVETTDQLHKRVENKLLTGHEIIVLEKAFLQTFAKRESLQRLYGQDSSSDVMMDLHLPQIRSETLALLRQTHQTESGDLDDATAFLDEDETPQRHEVAHLIHHFIHHGHLPPGVDPQGAFHSEGEKGP
jgi:hypothetical protein